MERETYLAGIHSWNFRRCRWHPASDRRGCTQSTTSWTSWSGSRPVLAVRCRGRVLTGGESKRERATQQKKVHRMGRRRRCMTSEAKGSVTEGDVTSLYKVATATTRSCPGLSYMGAKAQGLSDGPSVSEERGKKKKKQIRNRSASQDASSLVRKRLAAGVTAWST